MWRLVFSAKSILLLLPWAILFSDFSVFAQRTGYRPVEEPGIYGARIHPGALAPNRRKWLLPQNLYYEYRWKGWEYSNYARDHYQRYVDILLEGTRHYDPFGNYIGRGWEIYDWTETSPQRLGSGIFKSPRWRGFFNSILVSSANKGQFFTALTAGDAIRTSLTPLTFSKPAFNGIQWDLLSDKYAVTALASRLNSPGFTALSDAQGPGLVENSTRLLGLRGVTQVGDFAKLGATWVSAANASSELSLGDNSLKGVLTGPQNTGNVETITIRISDDSPESSESGALLYFDQVLIDGEAHPEIVPLISGGVGREGVLEARGSDHIELIYDIRNAFRPTDDVPTFRDARKLEFELVVANDYRIEVTSNLQTDRRGAQVFLLVDQAQNNIVDGANQRFIRFAYGLPTASEVLGIDLELIDLGGLELRSEYVVNRKYRRFPNQNFRKLAAQKETAEAYYATASYSHHPWFAFGEAYSMDPEYSTSAFIGDSRGTFDYSDEDRHLFEFVDDNDDQDRFPDWRRFGQGGQQGGATAGAAGFDLRVFPGLDENNDFVSDFNQNQNGKPDYNEPFLRYAVDPPEFLFGMDMNNNTIIDRFENDLEPDYPYDRDRQGRNVYGGLALSEDIHLTVGSLSENQLSSDRESKATYALLTAGWELPGFNVSLFEHAKWVKDNIPDDRIRWVDPLGHQDFLDPLENQDTFVNQVYLDASFSRIRDLNISGKLKYETFGQGGDLAEDERIRDRSFFGLINKADYSYKIHRDLTLWPKWKSTFRRLTPTSTEDLKLRDLEETLFLVSRYSIVDGRTWVDWGVELSWFNNLRERPDEPPPGFLDDFRSRVWSILFGNVSEYLGYQLTMNLGVQLERTKFEATDEIRKESIAFMRIFASTGQL